MLIINFENGFLRMDKTTGGILDYQVNGAEYVRTNPARAGEKSFYTNILRADTERDRAQSKKKKSGRLQVELRELSYKIKGRKEGGNRCEDSAEQRLYNRRKGMLCIPRHVCGIPVGQAGHILISPPQKKEPRTASDFRQGNKNAPSFTDITYYGMGPGEELPRHEGTLFGRHIRHIGGRILRKLHPPTRKRQPLRHEVRHNQKRHGRRAFVYGAGAAFQLQS